MFWSQHLGCRGQNTSRIQNKGVYATLCLQATPVATPVTATLPPGSKMMGATTAATVHSSMADTSGHSNEYRISAGVVICCVLGMCMCCLLSAGAVYRGKHRRDQHALEVLRGEMNTDQTTDLFLNPMFADGALGDKTSGLATRHTTQRGTGSAVASNSINSGTCPCMQCVIVTCCGGAKCHLRQCRYVPRHVRL